MSKIVIYAPFIRKPATRISFSDIQTILNTISTDEKVYSAQTSVDDIDIDSIQLIFKDEEKKQINQGDVLIVNGHGGNKDSSICDNSGQEIEVNHLMDRLNRLDCKRASVTIFYVCFSALDGHIAQTYKNFHKDQSVYGSKVACEGKDFFSQMTGRGERMKFGKAVWTKPGQSALIEMK